MAEKVKISPAVLIPVGLGLGLVGVLAVYALAQAAPPTVAIVLGNVYELINGAEVPVEGVEVNLAQGYAITYTDANGNYQFYDVPLTEPGYSAIIEFSKEGYYTQQMWTPIEVGENRVDVRMVLR